MHLKGEDIGPHGPFYRTFDVETGEEFHEVVEANTGEGWLVRAVTDEAGRIVVDGDEIRLERIYRPIRVEEIPNI